MGGLAIVTAIGGAFNVVGNLVAGAAEARAADFNAQVQERNAGIAEQNRQNTVRQSEIDAEEKRREGSRLRAAMRAAYGSSGLEMSGSPLDVLEDTAIEQELDVQRVEHEGRVRSFEGSLEVLGLLEGAGLSRSRAKGAKVAGVFGAVGAGLGSAGKVIGSMN